ncbi:TrbI/VirB10 family protein [Telmatospirillum siberiense]|uniref:Conjugal transfer protein TraI n=1 Tax=Telmatospirillum siberiense TaxID=382514 RepID=A0A2N3PRD5_9PROT|nr:TrbI/VirB10 family protein [Telmatospirillum siberiense]PKU22959.1 conjugal transfer protein TraI [Telmatospirillum siberiense]
MTGEENTAPQEAPVPPTAEPNLRLQAERPRVTRLSRKVLMTLGGISALAIAAALGYGLQSHKNSASPEELLGTQSRPAAEGLAGLPQDYTGMPKSGSPPALGPALPGDLGKPILNAQNQGKPVTVPTQGPNQAEQRLAQETEAARISRLFAQTGRQAESAVQSPQTTSTTATTPGTTPPIDAGAAQNMQDRKTAFMTGTVDRRTLAPDRLTAPASPFIIQAGTVIPAALITGIRSDLPGQITAQVTETIYDSPTGRFLLIPQGARLIGQYDSSVAFGQSRVLLVWTRLIMPNGKSIVLERQPGADTEGYAGLEDDVDYHWGSLFKGALLSTLLSVGAESGSSSQDDAIIRALRQGASNSISQTGQQIIQRQLNIQPTLTIRPGFPVRVLVTRDLILESYGG